MVRSTLVRAAVVIASCLTLAGVSASTATGTSGPPATPRLATVAGVDRAAPAPVTIAALATSTPATPAQPTDLTAVAALSSSDAWAVGAASTSTANLAVVQHWDGRRWGTSLSVNPGREWGSIFFGVAADAASDVWAVGEYNATSEQQKTLVEHWDGTSWRRVPSPNPGQGSIGDSLSAVAAVSPDDVWAVGSRPQADIPRPLLLHWDGSAWSSVPGVWFSGSLTGVAAASTDDVWAVGYTVSSRTGDERTFAEHWNGTAWTRSATAPLGGTENLLWSVASLPGGEAWAAGGAVVGRRSHVILEHYQHGTWTTSRLPMGLGSAEISSVAADSATDVWGVGTAGSSPSHTIVLHWNGRAWAHIASPPLSSPATLQGVSPVGPNSVWAVGTQALRHQHVIGMRAYWDGAAWQTS